MPPDRPGSGGGEDVRQPVTLREYFDRYLQTEMNRIAAEFQRVWDRFKGLQVAVDKAQESMDERMRAANEFRASLDDVSKGMSSRNEMNALKDSLEGKIESHARNVDTRLEAAERLTIGKYESNSNRIDALEEYKTKAETRREESKAQLDSRFRTFTVTMVILNLIFALLVFLIKAKL